MKPNEGLYHARRESLLQRAVDKLVTQNRIGAVAHVRTVATALEESGAQLVRGAEEEEERVLEDIRHAVYWLEIAGGLRETQNKAQRITAFAEQIDPEGELFKALENYEATRR